MTSIQKALEALPKSVGGYVSPEVQNISFSFMNPVRFSFERNTQGYITAWVTKGWPDYEVASEMAKNKEWVRLIAQALCLDPSQVSLGFGTDQFDVRPF